MMVRFGWQIITGVAFWFGITSAGCYNSHTTSESSAQTEPERDSETKSDSKKPDVGTQGVSTKKDSLQIEMIPDSAELCPGECIDIAVGVSGGNPPYYFSWDHELSSATTRGPHEVCPKTSTIYAVTVSDTGLDSQEFVIPAEQARGDLSVTVQKDCIVVPVDTGLDAGVGASVDADVDSATVDASQQEGCVEAELRQVCERTFPLSGADSDFGSAWGTGHNLVVDNNDDIILSRGYNGDLEMGETALSSDGRSACFVAKIDPDCSVRWARNLTSTGSVYGSEVAIGSDNSIYIGATYTGQANFGDGLLPVNSSSADWGVLIKLDSDGEMQWSRVFQTVLGSDIIADVKVTTIAVDSQGRLDIAVTGPADMLIDGHTVGSMTGTDWTGFIVQLDADGALRWTHEVQSSEKGASVGGYLGVAVAPDDTLVAFGSLLTHTVDFSDFILECSTYPNTRFLARLQADGALSWAKELPEEEIYSMSDNGGLFTVVSSGDIVMLSQVYERDLPIDLPRIYNMTSLYNMNSITRMSRTVISLERYTATGEFEWSRLHLRGYLDSEKLISDGSFGLTRLQSFSVLASYEGREIMGRGESDVLLIRETEDGQPVWTCQLGDERFNYPWDVAVDSSHNLNVAYESYESYDSPVELTVVRLAPKAPNELIHE